MFVVKVFFIVSGVALNFETSIIQLSLIRRAIKINGRKIKISI